MTGLFTDEGFFITRRPVGGGGGEVVDIKTDGTDKFKGAVFTAVDDGVEKALVPAATNDVITLNGTTKGGIVGSVVQVTAIDAATYLVHNSLLIGSGTLVTPFADA